MTRRSMPSSFIANCSPWRTPAVRPLTATVPWSKVIDGGPLFPALCARNGLLVNPVANVPPQLSIAAVASLVPRITARRASSFMACS